MIEHLEHAVVFELIGGNSVAVVIVACKQGNVFGLCFEQFGVEIVFMIVFIYVVVV